MHDNFIKLIVQEPGVIYLHEMTEPFIGISEKVVPWDIQNSTACVAQPGRLVKIHHFLSFCWLMNFSEKQGVGQIKI